MHFQSCQLSGPLGRCIESVFHYRDFVPDHAVERVVPTGHVFLLFELDGIVRNTFDNITLAPTAAFTRAWVSGVHHDFISISAHPRSEMFCIQFSLGGAHPFVHRAVSELNDRVVAAEEVFGPAALELHAQLLAGKTSDDKFDAARRWLEARFDPELAPPAALVEVIDALRAAPLSKVGDAATGYPRTQKHLIDQFKRFVGPTPKYLQRILRFTAVLEKVQAGRPVRWADLAAECGFSDQPHFVREFSRFSGFGPSEFVRNNHDVADLPNFFPVDAGSNDTAR